MTHITPYEQVQRAAAWFDAGAFAYHFDVPEGLEMTGYAMRVRKHARALGYKWSVVYSTAGRGWIIKQKQKTGL